jgi:peptidoglycan/LPS O-acetylase OafA/YrhL
MKHRSDIDGLRAIAVLPVIAFHYGMSRIAPGGFVGVDVFFVISGYLITGILYTQMNSGTYSLLNFYERRIRRIFPALFAMFAFCGVSSFALNFPSEAADIGRSIAASIIFLSNVLFFHSSSYFDQKMEFNPVLHTWSLSVEEQFYVGFPLLLLALRPLNHSVRVVLLGGIALASFAYSVWMVQVDSTAAFYLVQFRAWELLIGSLLAIGAIPSIKRQGYAEGLGIVGLTMIGASVVFISKETPFPGLAALLPCIGTGAILHSGAGASTWVGSLLSWRPIRFIGQISYSLYLWHWPLWVFYRLDHVPNNWSKLGLMGACSLMAFLSWRFIERPFRTQGDYRTARQTVKIACSVMITGITVALLLAPVSASLWKDLDRIERTLAYTSYDADGVMRNGTCFLTSGFNDFAFYRKDKCLKLKPHQRNFLLIGDSHAAHLWPGLIANHPEINFLQATASGCKPVVGTTGDKRCTDLIEFILRDFLPHHHIEGIILSARWASSDVSSVKATTAMLHAYAEQIAVFGPIVEYDQALPRILAKAAKSNEVSFASKYREFDQAKTDRLLDTALQGTDTKYFSVYRALCSSQCVVRADGNVPLQFDYGHLTREGSVFLMSKLGAELFAQPMLTIGITSPHISR